MMHPQPPRNRPPRRRAGTAWLIAALLAGIAASAAPAAAGPLSPAQKRVAQDDDDDDGDTRRAKQHFYKGEKLFALGRFKDALAEYEAAFQTKSLPEFLFNIGQCHRNLGDYESAIFSFRKYLKLKPDAVNRKAVEELIAELDIKIAEADRAERERREAELRRQSEANSTGPIGPGPTGPAGPIDGTSSPIYKKWWFWAGVVTVAAAGTASFLVIGTGSGIPGSDLGNLDFGK